MKTEKFMRKPFFVDAVQVTDENIEKLAEWCDGEVRTGRGPEGSDQKYIKVRVTRPLNERQTMAFNGDWILYAGQGYKVYPHRAFINNFDPAKTALSNSEG